MSEQLAAQLESIAAVLARIDRGAGLTEDRGFPWTAKMESEAGLDRVRLLLDASPALAAMLPTLVVLLADPDIVIGLGRVPTEEAESALRSVRRA